MLVNGQELRDSTAIIRHLQGTLLPQREALAGLIARRGVATAPSGSDCGTGWLNWFRGRSSTEGNP